MIMAVFRRPVLWNMRIDIYRDKNKTNRLGKRSLRSLACKVLSLQVL